MTTHPHISECPIPFSYRCGGDGPNHTGDTIIFIPGLGCSRDWFNTAFRHPDLRHIALASFDHTNQGDLGAHDLPRPLWNGALGTSYSSVQYMHDMLAKNWGRFHLVAHSMGNVAALMAWRTIPASQRGAFIAIEGTLTADDCALSSRHMAAGVEETIAFIEQMQGAPAAVLRRWGNDMASCDPEYLHVVAKDLVTMCQTNQFVNRWEMLKHAHYFYGDRSGYPEHHRHLFERTATNTVAIPGSGHFPMHENPAATWEAVATAIRSTHD